MRLQKLRPDSRVAALVNERHPHIPKVSIAALAQRER